MTEPTKLSTNPYKGVRDFYPEDWVRLQTLFASIRKTLTRSGYEEYNASPLERSELYESKGNQEIINEQTYTFTDRGDRRVTLRPEMTPTLARMVAAKRRELTFPLRWFSIGNRFRYERPQRGRLREFYQVDVDILGITNTTADAEIIKLAHTLLKDFGANEDTFTIRVSSRTLLNAACEAAGLTREQKRTYMRLLDGKAKTSAENFKASVREITDKDPLGIIEVADIPEVAQEKQQILDLIQKLKARDVSNVQFDPSITRGFDYYTGIVFEVYDTNEENSRALFGGGRYDELSSLFGGEAIPAVGFGMGDVMLANFLETHDLIKSNTHAPILFLGTVLNTNLDAAETMAEVLRNLGISVFVNLSEKSVGEQVKNAARRGIPYFAAVGEDESSSKELRVKRLTDGEEQTLALTDIPAFCTN